MTHSCELKNFSGKIFEDGCNIDCCLSPNAHLVLSVVLQESLDTTAGKLREKYVSKNRIQQCTHKIRLCSSRRLKEHSSRSYRA